MVDTMRKTVHSKLPVSPGMYRSSYKRDYRSCEEPLSEEDMQRLQIADSQLKAKEFTVPQEKQVMSYSDCIFGEGREIVPAPSVKAISHDDAEGRKPDGDTFYPEALQQRKRFTSVLPIAEGYPPKYYSATELAATQAEKLERLRALAELENELSYCQSLPAAAQTAGTAGMLLHTQKLVPCWATYKQFTMETGRATQHDVQQNKRKFLGLSVLKEGQWIEVVAVPHNALTVTGEVPTTQTSNSGREPVVDTVEQRALLTFSPKMSSKNHWVSEYNDSYSIFLRRLNGLSQIPAVGLGSELSSGKGIVTNTAQ